MVCLNGIVESVAFFQCGSHAALFELLTRAAEARSVAAQLLSKADLGLDAPAFAVSYSLLGCEAGAAIEHHSILLAGLGISDFH